MEKITVISARPQFIKAAVVSRVLREQVDELFVHTGQHYDYQMSDIFFDELNIPKPDYNLGVSGGSHGEMTGKMLIAIEDVLKKEQPSGVLLYGDTNSTLAAALAAVKLQIPVYHVEAGNRFGSLSNPEEVNRICTDRTSTLLMACTQSAMDFLKKEGLSDRAHLVGDPMYDAFIYYGSKLDGTERLNILGLDGDRIIIPNEYYYLTCHRQENTDDDSKLFEILNAMNQLDAPTIYPLHPRNRERVKVICESNKFGNIILTQPVGYLT